MVSTLTRTLLPIVAAQSFEACILSARLDRLSSPTQGADSQRIRALLTRAQRPREPGDAELRMRAKMRSES